MELPPAALVDTSSVPPVARSYTHTSPQPGPLAQPAGALDEVKPT